MADAYTTHTYGYANPQSFSDTEAPKQPRPQKNKSFSKVILVSVIITLFVMLILFLLSSNNKPSEQKSNTENTTDEPVVLQWWGVFLDEEVIQPILDDYKAIKPNVTIEYFNKWPGGSFEVAEKQYRSELNRVISSGNSIEIPDMFMVHNSWAADYEPYVKASTTETLQTFSSKFYPAIVKDFAPNQSVIGVPLWLDTFAILYNKKILEQNALVTPPTSWAEFRNAAQSLTKMDGDIITQAGFAAGTANNVSFPTQLLFTLFAQNGVEFIDEQGNAIFSTDEDSLDALIFYKSFNQNDFRTWNEDLDNDAKTFLEGKTAMIYAPSWRYRDILYFNKKYDLNLDIGVSPVPQLQGQNEPIINWADYWGIMTSSSRPYSDVAWEFMSWISEPEQLKKLNQSIIDYYGYDFGILYPRIDMFSELENDSYLSVFNESLPHTKTWKQVKGLEVKEVFKNLIEKGSSLSDISSAENSVQILVESAGLLN
jgi:ABC-type glycerol-3-phosphate transport system substrate-binding protein